MPNTNEKEAWDWRKELLKGLLNQSCERSGDGITAWYRIGQTGTYDWMSSLIEKVEAAALQRGGADEREKLREMLNKESVRSRNCSNIKVVPLNIILSRLESKE